eukprot:4876483-Heterocapsa_arctica.AAC.1
MRDRTKLIFKEMLSRSHPNSRKASGAYAARADCARARAYAMLELAAQVVELRCLYFLTTCSLAPFPGITTYIPSSCCTVS